MRRETAWISRWERECRVSVQVYGAEVNGSGEQPLAPLWHSPPVSDGEK